MLQSRGCTLAANSYNTNNQVLARSSLNSTSFVPQHGGATVYIVLVSVKSLRFRRSKRPSSKVSMFYSGFFSGFEGFSLLTEKNHVCFRLNDPGEVMRDQ